MRRRDLFRFIAAATGAAALATIPRRDDDAYMRAKRLGVVDNREDFDTLKRAASKLAKALGTEQGDALAKLTVDNRPTIVTIQEILKSYSVHRVTLPAQILPTIFPGARHA